MRRREEKEGTFCDMQEVKRLREFFYYLFYET